MRGIRQLAHDLRQKSDRLRTDDMAALNLNTPINLVFLIVGAMITMIVVAALFGDYADAVADINTNLTTADFGDATTNSIAPVFAIIVGISALAGLVGLIVFSVVKSRGG